MEMISIVTPVFNEEAGIVAFYERLKAVLRDLPDFEPEIIFVDDGSVDESWNLLTDLSEDDPCVGLLRFSRNFGHQLAITAGIEHARGEVVVVIDADLQDPPEVILELVEKWREGYDVVYAVRNARSGETRMKRWTAGLFYRLMSALSATEIPRDVGDFRLMSRRVVDGLKQMGERARFVRGMVSWLGFRQIGVTYQRDPRHAGRTKYTYRRMWRFAFDGITSFSTVPLKFVSWLGYGTSVAAFIYGLSVFIQKLMGLTVQGWATIMVALLFIGGVQLICLGILGEYIGRIFDEGKRRPLYVLEQTVPPAALRESGSAERG